MIAVFDEISLIFLTQQISTATNQLLEIVNYNMQGEQYVCAGTVSRFIRLYLHVP